MATRAKVLVAFASKHGSTRGIAHAVGGALHSFGCEVRVLPAGLVRSVLEYDAVLVGSAIYHDQWLWDARRLLRRVRGELANRPIWLFSSGPIGGTPEGDALVATGCGGGTAVPSTLLSPLRGAVDVTLTTADDVALGAWYLEPAEPCTAAVLVAQGNGVALGHQHGRG